MGSIATFDNMTNDEIIEYSEKCQRPVISVFGETYVVRKIRMLIDINSAGVETVQDINAFASEDEAWACAVRATANALRSDCPLKTVYTVECRKVR